MQRSSTISVFLVIILIASIGLMLWGTIRHPSLCQNWHC